MKCGSRITLGLLLLAALACADPDAELREEFQAAALALAVDTYGKAKAQPFVGQRVVVAAGEGASPRSVSRSTMSSQAAEISPSSSRFIRRRRRHH